jgi:hypothetical protein
MPLSVVARYRDPYEALLARSFLEAAGIPAFVSDEHAIGIDWLLSNSLGGVRLRVESEDADRAREVLASPPAEPSPTAAELPAARASAEPCPNCGTPGESLARADRRVRALSLLIGIPFALGRDKLRCPGCGVRWRSRSASRRSSS